MYPWGASVDPSRVGSSVVSYVVVVYRYLKEWIGVLKKRCFAESHVLRDPCLKRERASKELDVHVASKRKLFFSKQ